MADVNTTLIWNGADPNQQYVNWLGWLGNVETTQMWQQAESQARKQGYDSPSPVISTNGVVNWMESHSGLVYGAAGVLVLLALVKGR